MEECHRKIKASEKAGVKKRGSLSSGEVQLPLNCLGLELEHLIVPRGDEEQRMDSGPLLWICIPALVAADSFQRGKMLHGYTLL